MTNKSIEIIIIKFLNRSLNGEELETLSKWILNPKNEDVFDEYVKAYYEIVLGMNDPDIEIIKEKIFKEIKKSKSVVYKLQSKTFYKLTAAAASIALLVSVSFFSTNKNYQLSANASKTINETIKIGSDKAVLTLEDGSSVALEKGSDYKNNNVKSNGKELVYSKTAKKNLAYNYLSVPKGGQFSLILEDGTKVWLNSDSKLKYPVNFVKGEKREVELLYGEAYFDVSPSVKHAGASFAVTSKNQEVEVLGTEFNVKAYNDDENVYTTLVEGKVVVESGKEKVTLKPEQQSIVEKDKKVKVITVDIYSEVSWYKGIFSFKEKTLKEIMKVLSRWYDVEFTFKNKAIEKEMFVGVLNKKQKIEDLLEIIKNTGFITNYKIQGNKVTLE